MADFKFSSLTLFFVMMFLVALALPPTWLSFGIVVVHGVVALLMRHIARQEGAGDR